MELWTAVVFMLLAFIAGAAAAFVAVLSEPIGTLRMERAEGNEAPYLFLEIDRGKAEKLYSEKIVLVRVELPRK